MNIDTYRVKPGTRVALSDLSAGDTDGFDGNKSSAIERTDELALELFDLQQLLYADSTKKVLVVLQGMDSSGKDGTIKHVFKMINPLGVRVTNFKPPNDVELAHDYLWRVHQNTPRNGADGHLQPEPLRGRPGRAGARPRAPQGVESPVRPHPRLRADAGRRGHRHPQVLPAHRPRRAERDRLQERLDNPAKHWKFEHGDLEERKYWDAYTEAYDEAISRTSTDDAPWYVIPADKKWYRNLLISSVLVDTLAGLDLQYPEPAAGLDQITIDDD